MTKDVAGQGSRKMHTASADGILQGLERVTYSDN